VNTRVALVGAGPGDPALLTRRAVALLRRADLVLYDALVPLAIVDVARRARRFYVGKRAGRHAMTQESIHRLMIRAAARGQRVVRLKGGDPFVFGRGGEEVLALKAAGIQVEVVPGVSSALAGPSLAGIPVTHRGISTGVVIVSGHAESAYAPLLTSVAPNTATIVVLMGVATRGEIAARLQAAGWAPTTPAAIVFGAGQAAAHAWSGRLETIADAPVHENLPGTLVIGQVVALAPLIGGSVALSTGEATDDLERQGRG
jgi:uroporphyrin-III C-methyltransferase